MDRMITPTALTPAVFHILLALADGQKHGYAIMQEVEDHAAPRIRMGPGTLYGSLERLLKAGLIAEHEATASASQPGQRRRYYGLTIAGHQALQEETVRLSRAVAHARRKGVLKAVRT